MLCESIGKLVAFGPSYGIGEKPVLMELILIEIGKWPVDLGKRADPSGSMYDSMWLHLADFLWLNVGKYAIPRSYG